MGIFSDNPVLQREVRGRIRLRRLGNNKAGLWVLGLLALTIAYFYARGLAAIWHGQPQDAREFWGFLSFGLLVLVVLLAPALSSTAITQEREQQTWEILATTRLTGGEILLGKWLARQAPLALLALIALPLLFGCAVKGEIGIPASLAVLLFLAVTTGLYGALGLFCSYMVRKTAMATAVALTLTAFLCIGTPVIDALIQAFTHSYNQNGFFVWINPFYALSALMTLVRPVQAGTDGFGLSSGLPVGAILSVYLVTLFCALAFCLSLMIARYRNAVRER